MKNKTPRPPAPIDLNTPQALARFRKAAKKFTARAIESQESARAVLVREGIYTKGGKLTKRYR